MKIDKIKLMIAFVICAILGYLCYINAPAAENRNWISFIAATISLFLCMAPALAIEVEPDGKRFVSGKLTGWIFFIVLVIENFLFSHNLYDIPVYIATTALFAVIGVGIIYFISKS